MVRPSYDGAAMVYSRNKASKLIREADTPQEPGEFITLVG